MEKKAKKVWLYDENWNLDKSVTYDIKSVGGGRYRWETELTIVNPNNGEEKTICADHALYLPNDEIKDEDNRIYNFLKDNDLFEEVYLMGGGSIVCVSIEWGDWKHDHLYCDHIMGHIGYDYITSRLTEENGSDCYSAEHYYVKSK